MNKKLLFSLFVAQFFVVSLWANIFDDIKKVAKKATNKVGDAAKKAVKETKKVADKAVNKTKDIADDVLDEIKKDGKKVGKSVDDLIKSAKKEFTDVYNKVAECSQVAALGTEFAARKAEYFAVKTSLDAAKLSLTAAQKTADVGLAISAKAADIAGQILSKSLVIKKVYGRIAAADLLKGKLPQFDVDVIVAGKEFSVSVDWDLNDALQMAQSLAKAIEDKLPKLPFKIPGLS